MRHLKPWLIFLAKNLLVPCVFFIVFRFYGSKPAIALAVLAAAAQVIFFKIRGHKLSPFFLVASFFTILMGGADLFSKSPRFFRIEPFAQNFVIGTALVLSLIFKIPVLEWFAAALPESARPGIDHSTQKYFVRVTVAWVIYLYAKAAIFLYLAFHVDLGELMILRSVIGGLSLAAMLGGEILYRRIIRDRSKRRDRRDFRKRSPG